MTQAPHIAHDGTGADVEAAGPKRRAGNEH
jgi:hypothetical protein